MKKFLLIFLTVLFIYFPYDSQACTTFCFHSGGGWIYGRNYDWQTGHCMLVVNKRGVSKKADVGNNPAQWVSRYGSITFNQYGREFPLGGMNEAGLVMECMWLSASRYPAVDSRSELSELQWIQYQLDTAAVVEEVIAGDRRVRIEAEGSAPLHFLVCDEKGGAAVIEFLDGKMAAYTGDRLPYRALANSTYRQSVRLRESAADRVRERIFKWTLGSLSRFSRASLAAESWNRQSSGDPAAYAFKILDNVSQSLTRISVVYDVKRRRINFRTDTNRDIRFVRMKPFDLSCKTPVKILDLAAGGQGDVTDSFVNYTFKANYDLLKKSYRETDFTRTKADKDIRRRARYPETLDCKN